MAVVSVGLSLAYDSLSVHQRAAECGVACNATHRSDVCKQRDGGTKGARPSRIVRAGEAENLPGSPALAALSIDPGRLDAH